MGEVDIDKTGKVFNVVNDLLPHNLMKQKTAAAKKEQKSREPKGSNGPCGDQDSKNQGPRKSKIHKFALPYQGEPVMAWKVMLKAGQPARG